MAQKVQIVLTDDLDGAAADETVTFALDGTSYEIDLTSANAERLRAAIAPYVAAGRRAAGPRGRSAAPGRSARRRGARRSTSDAAAIRTWAKVNGHPVSERGRIPAPVRAAYEAAH